jgi:hypothetical protein
VKIPGLRISVVKRNWKVDVFLAVVIVVYVHFIQNVGIEGKVVGAIGGLQERVDVQNHHDVIWFCRIDEGVPVRDVGLLIESGDGRFALPGSEERAEGAARSAIASKDVSRSFMCKILGSNGTDFSEVYDGARISDLT